MSGDVEKQSFVSLSHFSVSRTGSASVRQTQLPVSVPKTEELLSLGKDWKMTPTAHIALRVQVRSVP